MENTDVCGAWCDVSPHAYIVQCSGQGKHIYFLMGKTLKNPFFQLLEAQSTQNFTVSRDH